MTLLERFLDPARVSLKICGVTTRADAEKLAAMNVDALGVNFWLKSKRYLSPEDAAWLRDLEGKILRVGVFVNPADDLPMRLYQDGLLDALQFHGDESPADTAAYRESGVPHIKAIGVSEKSDLDGATDFAASALLLDTRAPGVFGGTGETFDWEIAARFRDENPGVPVILAGGLTPANAEDAARKVRPAALDVASGAEVSPGIKDFDKVAAFLTALQR